MNREKWLTAVRELEEQLKALADVCAQAARGSRDAQLILGLNIEKRHDAIEQDGETGYTYCVRFVTPLDGKPCP